VDPATQVAPDPGIPGVGKVDSGGTAASTEDVLKPDTTAQGTPVGSTKDIHSGSSESPK